MYSSSRGILYTAPPGPDESDENRAADGATDANDEPAAGSAEAADGLAADD